MAYHPPNIELQMRKERPKPSQPGPRWIDRMQLAWSTSRRVDGIWIGSYETPDDLTRIEHALLLVKLHSPLHYARIIRELERIWISLLPHNGVVYDPSLKACVFDKRYMADPATSIEQIALSIVHESTHARLDRLGIKYEEELRARIEAICVRRELAFAARLPDGATLRDARAQDLNWYQDNPEYFHDARFDERHAKGEIEMLRHIGTPGWLIRAIFAGRSVIIGVRRLFRIA